METPISILQQYWGHRAFRAGQEDIIASVLAGHDTLALLPTGGGKSICFQVPALILEGVCIVITPLIALMKDQVEQLRQREILAVAIHSGMSRSQIDMLLDNCVHGQVKFLYVSPERLQTEIFIERVKRMKVGLIAVDEAHCISQWGYDFRPPYLKITALRELKPEVPVIALTATATHVVSEDIMDKLAFRKQAGVFRKSFARDNLSFVMRKTEARDKKLLEVLQKVKGSAIIYVRSRKATQEIAAWLLKRGISASYYHAGLSFDERAKRQDNWINNHDRVMVATNAFGMGIDKPDVRLVVHLDVPENLEAYYQEAGRAGRDGTHSFATILFQDADLVNLQIKTEQSHPSPDVLKKIYQALANYYQLAAGSGAGESYDFDLLEFSERFKLHQQEVYVALKKLEEEGLVLFNESFYNPSQLFFAVDKGRLYEFQIANARFDPMIKMLLRLYGGELFSGFIKISESYLANALKVSVREIVAVLKHLDELKIVSYQPLKDKPQLTFVMARQDAAQLPLNIRRLEERKELALQKVKSIIYFATSTHRCRMQLIQEYFGEDTTRTCGQCDVCIAQRKQDHNLVFEEMRMEILNVLGQGPMSIEELETQIAPTDATVFADTVRDLVDEGALVYDDTWRLSASKL